MQPSAHYTNKAAYFNEYLSCPDYKSIAAIVKSFPHLESLTKERDFNARKCRGVVIRSGNDDNIHKAIKYGVWTTTYRNKNKLEQYWRECVESKIDTYLFFSAVKSGHFQGVARLKSGFNDETFPFWWENQHGKFRGHFDIEWIYVKDITYRHFQGLLNEENEDITKSKDCDDISEQVTKKMLEIYRNYKKNKSIFNSFELFDKREKEDLRTTYTFEQQQYMMMSRQLEQMQLQQQLMYMMNQPGMMNTMMGMPGMTGMTAMTGMPAMQQMPMMPNPQELHIKEFTQPHGNGFVKSHISQATNPGFQMNPVSRQKKNTKETK